MSKRLTLMVGMALLACTACSQKMSQAYKYHSPMDEMVQYQMPVVYQMPAAYMGACGTMPAPCQKVAAPVNPCATPSPAPVNPCAVAPVAAPINPCATPRPAPVNPCAAAPVAMRFAAPVAMPFSAPINPCASLRVNTMASGCAR